MQVLDELGRGAQSAVYRVLRDGSDFAAKVLLSRTVPRRRRFAARRRRWLVPAVRAWLRCTRSACRMMLAPPMMCTSLVAGRLACPGDGRGHGRP